MMRLNLKVLVIVLLVGVLFVILSMWAKCGEAGGIHLIPDKHLAAQRSQDETYPMGDTLERGNNEAPGYEEIDCHINGEYSVSCRKEGDEIYVPFTFLHKYFEVYGKLATYDGFERFEWSHSYSKVYYPKGKYDPKGVFMYFDNYNVEVRERVKCVSVTEGVPVSTQWESGGYYYPTQVAQFGLAHYSKNLTEPEPRRKLLEDGEREGAKWNVPQGSSLSSVKDQATGGTSLRFSAPESLSSPGISLRLDHAADFVLSLDVRLSGNASVSVALQSREKKELFYLHYACADLLITATDNNIFHGASGCENGGRWQRLTRDLVIDLQKGLALQNRRRKVSRSRLRVVAVSLRGSGQLDNLTLASSDHMAHFYSAARWFVRHQAPDGGWPIPVRRRVAPGMADLAPGWLSAMSQGHAISVLARAYHHSRGDRIYLESAKKALKPFSVASADGGVRAEFPGEKVWYEEYPTQPPSFVLNGFIYALLGLYDLRAISPGDHGEAGRLYEEGLASLKAMLLLYDTGSGTVYDLRHLGLGVAPNIARWDYHATHVNQLLLLSTIEREPLLAATAERWISYMSGKRAAHN